MMPTMPTVQGLTQEGRLLATRAFALGSLLSVGSFALGVFVVTTALDVYTVCGQPFPRAC